MNFVARKEDYPQCDIYVNKEFFTSTNPLVCLIQGTGNVRAGIWARSVCINESLELGSVIPYVKEAEKNDMNVIIFNPNERKDFYSGERIDQFTTMEDHCLWVYSNIVKKFSNTKKIFFVSHSMGGYCTIDILKNFPDDINNGLIEKIAFTDSVHGTRPRILDSKTRSNLAKVIIKLNIRNLLTS